MNVMSFPVAAREYSSDANHSETLVDFRLLGELADEVVSLFRPAPRPVQSIQPAQPMTENERTALAKSACTPISVLEHLSFDQSPAVRNELIFNPAVPMHVLQNLTGDPDRFIAGQAKARLANVA